MRDNQAMLSKAAERVSLPLANLGNAEADVARALHDIADAFERAGRSRASNSIRKHALEIDARSFTEPEPGAPYREPS